MSEPMIFSHDEAFEQLRDEGVVYTIRKDRKDVRKTRWIRRSRTGEKEFDAEIMMNCPVTEMNEQQLGHFVDESGFENLEEWKEAVKSNNNGELPEEMYVHGVKRADYNGSGTMELMDNKD